MKTWQAIRAAIGSILGTKELVGLVAEYAIPTRESLAHEFGLMACQRTQQLLDLGRGNVYEDNQRTKNQSYANLQIIRSLYDSIKGNSELMTGFTHLEIQAYLAMVLHTGNCQEYSAVGYCYLKCIPEINSCFNSIERCLFKTTSPDGTNHNHAFIRIDVSAPGSKNPSYIYVDPWANYVGDKEAAKGLMLINNQSAAVVYNSAHKVVDEINQNIFTLSASGRSLSEGLQYLLNEERSIITPMSVASRIAKDKGCYHMQLLPPLANNITADPATIVIPEIVPKKEPVKAKVEVVHDSGGMSAYAHAAQATALQQETASAVSTATAASAQKAASAAILASAEPSLVQSTGDSNTQTAPPTTPSMGSGPS